MASFLQKFNPLKATTSAGLRSALPKVLVGAALLAGAGSVLSAGSAQATTTCLNTDPKTLTAGDKVIKNIVCGGNLADKIGVTLAFNQILSGLNYSFNSILGGGAQTGDFISYDIQITSPLGDPYVFSGVQLEAECFGSCTTTKTVYDKIGGTLLATLTVPNSGASPVSTAVYGYKALYVTDSFAATGLNAVLDVDNIFNQTPVPGPLPILGAGMAFGFSRKLRSRIKASTQA